MQHISVVSSLLNNPWCNRFVISCVSYIFNLWYFSIFAFLFFYIFFLYPFFLVCFPILGVGQRGVVVFHVLAWVRAAVARPVERAAETPALCAPSRHWVSSHGNHLIYRDQSALTQQWSWWQIMPCWTVINGVHLKPEVFSNIWTKLGMCVQWLGSTARAH